MKKNRLGISQKILRFILSQYKTYKLNRVNLSSTNAQKCVEKLLSKARYAFVITHSNSNSSCNARYVQPIVKWNGGNFKVWVGTSAKSRKIVEITTNPNVTLAIGNDTAGANLIIQGKAAIHTDLSIRLKYWQPVWRLFFPDGPKSDDYVVISIEPLHLELMDFSGNVIPEPFGLRHLKLTRHDHQWIPIAD